MPVIFKSALFVISLFLFSTSCIAQLEPAPAPEVPPTADWTLWQGQPDSVQLRARLRDEALYAAQHTAAVEVEVQKIWLTRPVPVPQGGVQQGILRYQLDQCPPAVTTDTRLRFEQLSPGSHTITVVVLGLDHRLLTPFATLHVKIP